MKKIVFALMLFYVFGTAGLMALGDENLVNKQKIEAKLGEIRQAQKLDKAQPIDCFNVSSKQLEELGDLIIESGEPKERDLIDKIMGGDDSPTDQVYHRFVAAKYLGCFRDGKMNQFFGARNSGEMHGLWMDEHMSYRMKAKRLMFGTVCLVLTFMIFSAIFWLTYRWLGKSKQVKENTNTAIRRKGGKNG